MQRDETDFDIYLLNGLLSGFDLESRTDSQNEREVETAKVWVVKH